MITLCEVEHDDDDDHTVESDCPQRGILFRSCASIEVRAATGIAHSIPSIALLMTRQRLVNAYV